MSFQLTRRVIKLLCGAASYKKGEAYSIAGKVTETRYDPEASVYTATVTGSNSCAVTIEIDQNGDVDAECTCRASNYCGHIAAVLLDIHDVMHGGQSPVRSYAFDLQPESGMTKRRYAGSRSAGAAAAKQPVHAAADRQLAGSMLDLFIDKPLPPSTTRPRFETRATLDVEITCKTFPYGYGKHMFGIELKLGPKRLYIVQNIRDFLERFERQELIVFSKQFTYDPQLHCFHKEHDAIIRQLIQIFHNENLYRETTGGFFVHARRKGGDRLLPVPPVLWESLFPLLVSAPSVLLEQNNRVYEGIRLSDGQAPLQFEFDQDQSDSQEGQSQTKGYQLNVQGLDNITILESYGVVLSEGKLLQLEAEPCKRLAGLKQLLDGPRKQQLPIPQEQMESFMEKAIPGLMKLGSVRITQAVSDRIVHRPLKAKLFLDRVKDRLLAGLEFQYGDIVINPLEGSARKRGTELILMRDGEHEQRIIGLMEQSSFAKTDSGYFLNDEEAEYEFLYHTVPQLEKLADVYATSAVKTRVYTAHTRPKITVHWDERTDWLDFRFDIEGIPEAEIRKLLMTLEEKRKYYRLPGGALLPLESAEFQEIIGFMNDMGIHKADLKGTDIRLPLVRGLHLADARKERNAVRLGKSFRQLLDNIRNPDNLEFPVPDSLAAVLRDYQKYGFGWLKTLAHYNFGGILADDMGLGKTVQSIAFIVSVLQEIRNRRLPALIVSPASLVYNWQNELKKFAPDLCTVIADGSKEERSAILHAAAGTDVIITSYPLLRRDIDMYAVQPFHTLILDEAQFFKNYATRTAQAVKQLQARHRFALTGTPVENSLEELWSIFDAVFPELFPGRKAFNDLSRETVAKRIRPFLLRRLKTDVLKELPEKIESLQASELLPEQKKLYVAYLAKLQQETLKHLDSDGFQKNRIKILAGLTRLRQLCCHPALFIEDYAGSSAKFEQLLEIIAECRSAGKRMLIFSQFTGMLDLIRRELGYRGVPHFYLDGQTAAAERVKLCSRFNEGERDLFLISLKAGGTGLNLTGADTVILYDLWWNPAVEQQAADRAHRIGQKNVVQVIRLISQGTVEDKMYELQQKKKNLIDEVIEPGQETLSAMTEQEIREILMI